MMGWIGRISGLCLLSLVSGCVMIPGWRLPRTEIGQKAEDTWGDAVDTVCHKSPIDQPWTNPQYCKRAVYRVAPWGIFDPVAAPEMVIPQEEIPPVPTPAPAAWSIPIGSDAVRKPF